ncbi:Os02g0435075 [Oryza sativa Japonica Group]|uniref:Os02g0435075 protein n=1 Tax=Oryza sativa subsp. japonica TaxID=39947 RepID=A0A0P0VIG6_ORYSJ|nr:Os02g0435075 [Oryza sativa Japonica Group]
MSHLLLQAAEGLPVLSEHRRPPPTFGWPTTTFWFCSYGRWKWGVSYCTYILPPPMSSAAAAILLLLYLWFMANSYVCLCFDPKITRFDM